MKPSERKVFRCAIYTRKSTEHNLDLEFNSLDGRGSRRVWARFPLHTLMKRSTG
jgi:hypothetical protein